MKLPHPEATRETLRKMKINYGTFDDEEMVSARELYEALALDGSGVDSLYITIQAAGVALDVGLKMISK